MQTIPDEKIPTPDPATDTLLFRSLRHNPDTGLQQERGTDLFAKYGTGKGKVFYFRHWTGGDTGPGTCQVTSREEAVRFLREQYTEPGFFSGWTHKAVKEFLPELCRKE
ncbi:MAG: hypothetical protein WC586_03425 [Methanoregula sp.]